jgi:F-box and WD-40 domain protein 1/11
MTKRERYSPVESFSPAHQPDEGYSEDPLNSTVQHHDLSNTLSTLRTLADLPTWLEQNSYRLPVSVKTGKSSENPQPILPASP